MIYQLTSTCISRFRKSMLQEEKQLKNQNPKLTTLLLNPQHLAHCYQKDTVLESVVRMQKEVHSLTDIPKLMTRKMIEKSTFHQLNYYLLKILQRENSPSAIPYYQNMECLDLSMDIALLTLIIQSFGKLNLVILPMVLRL